MHKRPIFLLTAGLMIVNTIIFRFTDFFMQTRLNKVFTYISVLIVVGLLLLLLIKPLVETLLKGLPKKHQKFILFVSLFITTGLFLGFYQLPPFPQTVNLEIFSHDPADPSESFDEIIIQFMQIVNLPSGEKEPIFLNNLNYQPPWIFEDYVLRTETDDKASGSVKFTGFLQGRVDIAFEIGPSSNTVLLNWNGSPLVYDLNHPYQDTKLIHLEPGFEWNRADTNRKVLLGINLVSEYVISSLGLFLVGSILSQILIRKQIKLRGIAVLISIFLVSSAFIFLNNRVQEQVVFDDPNLNRLIREVIQKEEGPIYKHQLLTIATLDANNLEIESLEGIQALRNLKTLNLSVNLIQDVSPLAELHNLTELDLSHNQIVDLYEVNFEKLSLNQLETLNLSGNMVNDVKPLARFNNLTDLDLSYNQIIDFDEANFDQLQHLKLERLVLRSNFSYERALIQPRLSNIDILEKFSDLQVLDLGENQISDISVLENLTSLSVLYLDFNHISDISPVGALTNLTFLNLRNNNIENISPLENLVELKYLNVNSNERITDFSPLIALVNMERLTLSNIFIGDSLDFIRGMQNLQRLRINNCGVTNLADLGYLMANGALQDIPERRVFADVSIRDNPLDDQYNDPFAPVRDYWHNITNKYPVVLPPLDNISHPVFSHHGGFYENAFDLSLTQQDDNTIILYTLDGSEPNIDNVSRTTNLYQNTFIYESPIRIDTREDDPNLFSMINTADIVNIWLPTWSPPKGNVYKATVVRAMTYHKQTGEQSPIETHTFFVDEDIYQRYATLPIISLTSDYQHLFDPETGIYTPGTPTGLIDPMISFNESTVPANLEFFEPGGTLGISGVFDIRLQGNTSRASPQKSIMVIANPWYGHEMINYPFFQNSDSGANQLQSFKRIMIRSWGSARAWPVIFSDAYHQTLMAKADLEIQDYQPVIVFINGEYWGLHEIRESNKNSWYHQSHTGIDRDDPGFDLIDGGYNQVDEGDSEHWDELIDFILNHDLSEPEHFTYVETKVDIDNFIHYITHCIYTGKRDWPYHNESKWRVRLETGRWRWTQFDMDHGLSQFGRPEYDMVYHTVFDQNRFHPLLAELLKNEAFKNRFLNYFADNLNTYFLPSVELNHFNKMVAELEPYIPEYQDRWQLNDDWDDGIQYGLDLIERRHGIRWEQIKNNFDLEGTYEITLQTNPPFGKLQINSAIITATTPGVTDPSNWTGTYFSGIPVEIRAIPEPGYQFKEWIGVPEDQSTAHTIRILPLGDTTITAIFEVKP